MRYLPLLLVALVAADTDISVQKITFKESEFDSLADTLRIMEKSGTVELTTAELKGEDQFAHIEVELYKDGERLPEVLISGGIVAGTGKREKARLQFSLKVIDMDYLMLGDGKKDHCRLVMRVSNGVGTLRGDPRDVSKEECDVSKLGSSSGFGPKASTADRIPLFWLIDISKSKRMRPGNTPDEVVKNNPIGDLAIVSIRLTRTSKE